MSLIDWLKAGWLKKHETSPEEMKLLAHRLRNEDNILKTLFIPTHRDQRIFHRGFTIWAK